MDIQVVKAKVQSGQFVISTHADEKIDIAEIRDAILNDEMLEQYADTGRGESCLILGFVDERPIHVICGWRRESIVIITVYVPKLPKFQDPWTRRRSP